VLLALAKERDAAKKSGKSRSAAQKVQSHKLATQDSTAPTSMPKSLPPPNAPFSKSTPKHMTVHLTSLFMSTTTIWKLDPSLSIHGLKEKFAQKGEKLTDGITPRFPPAKQWLWFPVPDGTEGSQLATHFPWWEKRYKQIGQPGSLPKELFSTMIESPLLLPENDQTIGGLAALQGGGSVLKCFFIANVAERRYSTVQRLAFISKRQEEDRASKSGSCCVVQ
jgi:hypothetical protein